MKKLLCYIDEFKDYGLFVGVLLSEKSGNKNKIRQSTEFHNEVALHLDSFLAIYSYTRENVEKYFNR